MKIFIDSADIQEIDSLISTGLIDGVTTNPSLIAKSGQNIKEVIKAIAKLIPNSPVSAEVTATDYHGMLKEAEVLRKLGKNIAIKVPLTFDGLKVCKALSDDGTEVNVTLCFSPSQAILAAKSGATYISPFIGRLDDSGLCGLQLIADIIKIYKNYPEFNTQVLAASIRGIHHAVEAAKIGAHIATIPANLFKKMYQHPLTDKGLDLFLQDWKKSKQSIL